MYFDTSGLPVNYSGFLEALLVEKHPEIFGDDAPLPTVPSPDELLLTKNRQEESRSRYDDKDFHKSAGSPGPPVSKPKPPQAPVSNQVLISTVKLLKPEEVEEDDNKIRQKHMQPSVLIPVVEDKEEDDEEDDGPCSGVVMF